MSTAKLKEMRWGNTFSYGPNNVIRFDAEPLVQIIGENGAGKSSIPTVMEEGLFNKNSKGFTKAAIPNRNISEPYYIDIDFDINVDEYTISVVKASSLKATLLKNGEDISAHTPSATIKMVEELFNIPFKTFSQLIYQNIKTGLQFLTATDSKRKEFLIELFDLSEYTEPEAKFKAALKNLNDELKKLEGKIESSQSSLTRVIKEAEGDLSVKVPVPGFPEELIREQSKLEGELENIEKSNKDIVRSNKVLSELSTLRTVEEIKKELERIKLEDSSPLVEQFGRRNSEISAAKKVVEKIKGLSGQCPTCLQEIDTDMLNSLIKENESIIDSSRAEAKIIAERLDEIKALEKKQKILNNELSQRKNIEARIVHDTYQETIDYEDLEESINSIASQIKQAKAAIDQATEVNKKVDRENAKIEAAKEQIDIVANELETYEDEFNKLEKKKGPLEVLKKAFGSSGLVAYKLENVVKDLEDETNKYLARLSGGKFSLAFELVNDKLNVVIFDDGSAVTMTSLSSGEEARVLIGTLLGIRKIMGNLSKQNINVLFLDEVISVMDDQGKEQLVEVLLEEHGLNTFLVSHSWSHPLVTKLEVIKEDDISRIV